MGYDHFGDKCPLFSEDVIREWEQYVVPCAATRARPLTCAHLAGAWQPSVRAWSGAWCRPGGPMPSRAPCAGSSTTRCTATTTCGAGRAAAATASCAASRCSVRASISAPHAARSTASAARGVAACNCLHSVQPRHWAGHSRNSAIAWSCAPADGDCDNVHCALQPRPSLHRPAHAPPRAAHAKVISAHWGLQASAARGGGGNSSTRRCGSSTSSKLRQSRRRRRRPQPPRYADTWDKKRVMNRLRLWVMAASVAPKQGPAQ